MRSRAAAPSPNSTYQASPGLHGRQRPRKRNRPLQRDYLTTVSKWLQERLGLENGRQALLLEHMVKFGAISSEGTHITTIIVFSWHPDPLAGCLPSSIFFFFKEEKKMLFGN